ncbi:MAG: argininosuccinate synthase [Omnitrophica WOR_2 bacterium RIFCSPHIGHO2_02_FULL_68_15]|nr:MAG: argininosuccinate synthase [Omnitrophica WOR_2 bacterium RIFCSPHIGHO2_02_FULL_68_15]
MNPKVVLAYSGGLDTTVCLQWLKDRQFDVIAFCVDVGQGEDLQAARRRALACGAVKALIHDLRQEFVRDFVLPALKADAVYEGKYLLATALSRPLIAKHLAQVAKQEGATHVAHGCTGKGNDQVRFEVTLAALAPSITVLAPVREWELKSREEEIAYAQRHRLPITVTKKMLYSLDQNLWGGAIECGPLEDPWTEPPEGAYQWTRSPQATPKAPAYVTIGFRRGVPVTLNGRRLPLMTLIQRLNTVGARYGVGRSDLIEDRLVGIKSREVYEAPAATILHTAHRELESLTLHRETLEFKDLVAARYARLIYDGLWYAPLRTALDGFVDATQAIVTGEVRMKLWGGQAAPVGRRSPHTLYRKTLATYGREDAFDQKAAAGFIAIWGLPYKATGTR